MSAPEAGGALDDYVLFFQRRIAVGGCIAGALLLLLKYYKVTPFKVMYVLYTRTPVGKMFHRSLVTKSRKAGPHSSVKPTCTESFSVVPIPMLSDNYGYLLIDHATGHAAAVDPCDAEGFLAGFRRAEADWGKRGVRLDLRAVLTTHYHHDHAGGNLELAKWFPRVEVVSGHLDAVAGITRRCKHREQLSIGDTLVTVLFTPGHTKGHVMFFCTGGGAAATTIGAVSGDADAQQPAVLFTGDCLFIAGVGKFFEGTPAQMHQNMRMLMEELPGNTLVFPGHEYTEMNLEFAAWVEGANADVMDKLAWTREQRSQGLATIPSTLEGEKKHNPYMRWSSEELVACVKANSLPGELAKDDTPSPDAVIGALRRMKDQDLHLMPQPSATKSSKL